MNLIKGLSIIVFAPLVLVVFFLMMTLIVARALVDTILDGLDYLLGGYLAIIR